MNIVINPLDPKSITKALKQMEKYKKDFEQKEQEFFRRLVELGFTAAQTGFEMAAYDGTKDVVVRKEKNQRGYSIVASGKTVGFIEFGTGVRYREWNSAGMEYTPPPHGSYGHGLGKLEQGWRYKGEPGTNGVLITEGKHAGEVHTYGNPPAEAMRTARDEMIQNVIRIAREVWR